MAPSTTSTDEFLGLLTRNERINSWEFSFSLPLGRDVRGAFMDSEAGAPPDAAWRCAGVAFLRWLRRHDAPLRGKIAAAMFEFWQDDWFDPEIDTVRTQRGFQRTLQLRAVNIYNADSDDERRAELFYDDGNLFGGHVVTVYMDLQGNILSEPQIAG